MSDPIEGLDSFNPEVPINPLSAADVRRRGDRLRRRNTVLSGVGAALAVALIATPIAVLGGGDEGRSTPGPANPSQSVTGATDSVVTEISPDIDLAQGLPEPDGDYEVEGPSPSISMVDETACGVASLFTGRASDTLGVRATGPEYLDGRELRTFATEQDAIAVLDHVNSTIGDCPRDSREGSERRFTLYPNTETGRDTVTFALTYEQGLGGALYQFVRVGNAVLLTESAGEYSLESIGPSLRERGDLGQRIAAEMCIFSAEGCGEESGASELTEDALLTVGEVPARERLTEWTAVTPAIGELIACDPAAVGALGAQASVRRDFVAEVAGTPDSGRPAVPPVSIVKTAVLQFEDDAAAAAANDSVAGSIDDCSSPAGDLASQVTASTTVDFDGGQGQVWQRDFLAPEMCGGDDCDAVRFDRTGVALVGDRLVIVSLGEVGGPLEPEGLDQTMTELFALAIAQSRP